MYGNARPLNSSNPPIGPGAMNGRFNLSSRPTTLRERLAQRIKAEKDAHAQKSGLGLPALYHHIHADKIASDRTPFSGTEMSSVSNTTTLPHSTSSIETAMPTPPATPAEKNVMNTAHRSQCDNESPLPIRDNNGFVPGAAKLNRKFLPSLANPEPSEDAINPKTGKTFTKKEWEMQVRVRDHRRLERAAKRNKDQEEKNQEVEALLEGKDGLSEGEKMQILVKALSDNTFALKSIRASHVELAAEKERLKRDKQRSNAEAINYRNDLEQAKKDSEKERKALENAMRVLEVKLAEKETELDSASKRLGEAEDRSTKSVAELVASKSDLNIAKSRNSNLEKQLEQSAAHVKELKADHTKTSEDLQTSRKRIQVLKKQLNDQHEELMATNGRISHQNDALRHQQSSVDEADGSKMLKGIPTNPAIGSKIADGEGPSASTSPIIDHRTAIRTPHVRGKSSKKSIIFSVIAFLGFLFLSASVTSIFHTTLPAVDVAPEFGPSNQHLVFDSTTCSFSDAPSTSAVAPIPTSTVATYTSAIPDDFFASLNQVVEVPDNSSFVKEEGENEWMEEGICVYEEFPKVRKAIFTAVLAVGIHGIVWLTPMLGA